MEGATVPCGCKKPACLWNRADLKMPREQRQNHVSDLYQAVPGAITKCHRLGGMYLFLSWRLRVKTKVLWFLLVVPRSH